MKILKIIGIMILSTIVTITSFITIYILTGLLKKPDTSFCGNDDDFDVFKGINENFFDFEEGGTDL